MPLNAKNGYISHKGEKNLTERKILRHRRFYSKERQDKTTCQHLIYNSFTKKVHISQSTKLT